MKQKQQMQLSEAEKQGIGMAIQ